MQACEYDYEIQMVGSHTCDKILLGLKWHWMDLSINLLLCPFVPCDVERHIELSKHYKATVPRDG